MKVVGLNGIVYSWNLSSFNVNKDDTRKRSKYHTKARKLLKEIYHSYRILEEVKLPGSTARHKRGVLYLDFYIPQIQKAFEVHGQQHYEYCPFFHKSKADFILAKSRDEDKIEWCRINGINITILKYSEDENEWTRKIKS